MVEVVVYVGLFVWISFGAYSFYMTVRDDRRSEKERKGK